ncbi:pantetheine-phosphate adenylyltransferase [Varunaivibrio sulfuroxidans]|uniref:Phosphopantetheine adenylyltransferase n=1 Tax=Varunaivibrio sulfuroxidans TaxID=1773489 RepID=A0A4R3J7C3_9PROT|nr:pantetheine-phosphate adenylyltransferase [Varunaivibrio sulfuroxidans]TCS61284.1 phosphopantetheine adenylyltransferase [Varunaivibrio sulfuroxidans]WES31098.1 pantetheine-phosphate adenylyltransferase [Varunaivibrio sulfuroxidans]
MTGQRTGVYPGTFDPVTNGHLDIIARATRIVDRLIVAVAVNDGKDPLFAVDDRVALLNEEIATLGEDRRARIEVVAFDSLLVKFVQDMSANVIVRGLRAVSDFEYEFQMAGMNSRLDPSLETVFLMSADRYQFISSRFVKEIARLGGDIEHFVSPRVAQKVRERFDL